MHRDLPQHQPEPGYDDPYRSVCVERRSDTSGLIGRSLSVIAVNDAPIASASSGLTVFVEGLGSVPIDSGVTLSDADSVSLAWATVRFTAGYDVAEDATPLCSSTRNHRNLGRRPGSADLIGHRFGGAVHTGPAGRAVHRLQQQSVACGARRLSLSFRTASMILELLSRRSGDWLRPLTTRLRSTPPGGKWRSRKMALDRR